MNLLNAIISLARSSGRFTVNRLFNAWIVYRRHRAVSRTVGEEDLFGNTFHCPRSVHGAIVRLFCGHSTCTRRVPASLYSPFLTSAYFCDRASRCDMNSLNLSRTINSEKHYFNSTMLKEFGSIIKQVLCQSALLPSERRPVPTSKAVSGLRPFCCSRFH